MWRDLTGLQADLRKPLPAPDVAQIIRNNPQDFVERMPSRYREMNEAHRESKIQFIQEAVYLYFYAKEDPTVYEAIRGTNYFVGARQKYARANGLKLICYHMLQPKIKKTRDRAGKYFKVGLQAIRDGCEPHQVAEYIKAHHGIERTYALWTKREAKSDSDAGERPSQPSAVKSEPLKANLAPNAAIREETGHIVSRVNEKAEVELLQKEEKIPASILSRFLLINRSPVTFRALVEGGRWTLTIQVEPKSRGFKHIKVVSSQRVFV